MMLPHVELLCLPQIHLCSPLYRTVTNVCLQVAGGGDKDPNKPNPPCMVNVIVASNF